jgi:hypothetical protein
MAKGIGFLPFALEHLGGSAGPLPAIRAVRGRSEQFFAETARRSTAFDRMNRP